MSKSSKILLILLVVVVAVGVGIFIWKNNETKQNNANITTNTSINTNTNSKKINDNVLELSVSKALIEVVNDDYYKNVSSKEGTIAAEGHKILKSEIKDNQIYAYVVAEYGVYKLENNEVVPVSASASPITLIFDMEESNGYKKIKYLVPSDAGDEEWLTSLKEMFPADLIDESKSINYKDDFYQKQIKAYI